jgi:cytochrome b561
MIWAGWTMVGLDDKNPVKFDVFYPLHKSFGVLVFLLVLTQLALRRLLPVPAPSRALSPAEARLAKIVHRALYGLMILVPLLGYSRSSTFTDSDGVTLFGLPIPELLGKNDAVSDVLSALHRIAAYSLLALVLLHVMGALKHRFFDRRHEDDPLSRML